jgi:hypothetical protein
VVERERLVVAVGFEAAVERHQVHHRASLARDARTRVDSGTCARPPPSRRTRTTADAERTDQT